MMTRKFKCSPMRRNGLLVLVLSLVLAVSCWCSAALQLCPPSARSPSSLPSANDTILNPLTVCCLFPLISLVHLSLDFPVVLVLLIILLAHHSLPHSNRPPLRAPPSRTPRPLSPLLINYHLFPRRSERVDAPDPLPTLLYPANLPRYLFSLFYHFSHFTATQDGTFDCQKRRRRNEHDA
jgi:hypothetical protein